MANVSQHLTTAPFPSVQPVLPQPVPPPPTTPAMSYKPPAAAPELKPIQEHYLKRELVRLEIESEFLELADFRGLRKFGAPFAPNGPGALTPPHEPVDEKEHYTPTLGSPELQPQSSGGSHHSGKSVVVGSIKNIKKTSSHIKKHLHLPHMKHGHELDNGDLGLAAAAYSDPPSQRTSDEQMVIYDFPIVRHMFVHHIKTFPFLSKADDREFWQLRLQAFLESFADKNISSSEDRAEDTKRSKISLRIKKAFAMYMSAGLQTTSVDEPTAKVEKPATAGVEQLDHKKVLSSLASGKYVNGVCLNVVGVREVRTKRMLSFLAGDHVSAEYLIETKMESHDGRAVVVARTFHDFKELAKKLHREFPGRGLPNLPVRNRTASQASSALGGAIGGDDEDGSLEDELNNAEEHIDDDDTANVNHEGQNVSLPREKQRTTLRAYMHSLIANRMVANSKTLLEFLYMDPIKMNSSELRDAELRRKVDIARVRDQLKFYEVAQARAQELNVYLQEFKTDLVREDGLKHIFDEIRNKSSASELSPRFQKFIKWATIEFAATLFHMFVASDNAPEVFAQVCRLHRLIPYMVIKGILRLSNPVSIMKGMMDLFLAQPFGRKSLFQTIIWYMLQEDIKQQERAIKELKLLIADDSVCQGLEDFVYAGEATHQRVLKIKHAEDCDMVLAIFKLQAEENHSWEQERTVRGWYERWDCAVEEDPSSDPHYVQPLDVAKFSATKDLLKHLTRKRDKDMFQDLINEKATVQLVKDLITIFYEPLIRVFKDAHISEAVGDLQRFADDLIKTVSKSEIESLTSDANSQVQLFVDLCNRHVDALFRFIHNVYQHDGGLFDQLMGWISEIILFLKDGQQHGQPLDLEHMLSQYPGDKAKVVAEVDKIVDWTQRRKDWYDSRAAAAQQMRESGVKRLSRSSSVNSTLMAMGEDAADDIDTKWDSTLPGGPSGMTTADFGIDIEDINELELDVAELELEDRAIMGKSEGQLDAVEEERRRRQLAKKMELKQHSSDLPPQRPEIVEIPKMLPCFRAELLDILDR